MTRGSKGRGRRKRGEGAGASGCGSVLNMSCCGRGGPGPGEEGTGGHEGSDEGRQEGAIDVAAVADDTKRGGSFTRSRRATTSAATTARTRSRPRKTHARAAQSMVIAAAALALVMVMSHLHTTVARRATSWKCGSSRKYWSSSCGPIGSATARHCSEGGSLVNPNACITHFESGSRACGFLLMGCRSLCKLEEVGCQPGRVTFATKHTVRSANATTREVEVLVGRQYGADMPIQVDVEIVRPGQAYGSALPEHRQTLCWGHMDAEPKRVFVDIAAASSLCSQAVESECHVDVVLLHPQSCRVGAYRSTHLGVHRLPASTASTVRPVRTSYVVEETEGHVDLEVERTHHTTTGPSSVDVAFVSSTGSPFIDFHFQENRTLSWSPNGPAVQTFRLYVRPNHEHTPNDTVYLTFVNPYNMHLPAKAQVVQVTILNANDSESCAERNLTQSSSYRQQVMPWVSEIKDSHAAQRFLEAWNAYPVQAGEVVIQRGRVPRFLAVVAEGTFEMRASAFGKNRARRASRGDLVSFFSAVKRSNSTVEVKALTKGLLFVLDHHLFHLHNKSANQDIFKVLKHEFLRQMILRDGRRFPVAMFPGFMSTQLEAWKRKQCSGVDIEIMDQVWLSLEQMMQTITVDRYCWLECLALGINQTDDSCKVRAGSGIAAIRELNANIRGITTIFRSIMTFLAEKWGYDSQSLIAMPYDWRLSPDMLQQRDKFFSVVKAKVETAVAVNEAPAIFIAHSLGNSVIIEFFAWLEREFPDSYLKWTEKHVIAYYGIAPAFRGATQAAVAQLVGDNMGLPVTNYQSRVFGAKIGSSPWMFPLSSRYPTRSEYTCGHPYCGEGATTLRLREPNTLSELKTKRFTLNEYETMCQAAQWHTSLDQEEVEQADLSSMQATGVDAGEDENATATVGAIEEGGWPRFLFNITLGDGKDLTFGVNDLHSGKLFEDLAKYGNDSHAARVAETIRKYYNNPEIPSPFDRLPTRPPIKHVAIIYGVNRKTTFAMHAVQTQGSDELTVKDQVFETKDGNLTSGAESTNTLRCSGDGTVPYASLSWAHAWHLSPSVSVVRNQEAIQPFFDHVLSEYTPAQVSRVIDTVWPEHTIFDSDKNGYRTTVYEVEGMEHREAVRTAFTIELVDSLMQDLVQMILHGAVSDAELVRRGEGPVNKNVATTAVAKQLREVMQDLQHSPDGLQRLQDVLSTLEEKK